ncbi:tripartite tricarboxylate transporter substrate binding protein [Anoxynatronum buryatiense]|uniref:Tripartite-type tricarboxylate transporter, receptor component TctC n=1 Tax=Anoxynatronum buryatiense TaxID=489973 RepID=A0AA45WY13_9CLOT|nr:tripartite tricarboxylate transporter substrate binding protein [Anoxynatronum buryatiense]SMP66176.1 Tripartite-type tricarboxylate transporter, receptor component TctC [Anoxynatronum buryatiense]
MKKKHVLTTVMVLLISVIFAGCGGGNNGAQTTETGETDWPKETVTFVVPYSAGGDTDTYARQLAAGLSNELDNNFIVVNTVGGGGVVAGSSVLGASPDGYTALFHHTGVMLAQEAADAIEFSYLDDFEMVASVARDDTYALIAKADSPWTTLEDMISWAQANPGQLRYSITYYGATHAVATMMENTMDIEMNNIDVGSATADRLTAFMADQCDVLVVNFMNIEDYIENGDFVVLGIASEERLPGLEEFPTIKEQGYNVVLSKIYEVRLPKGTDQRIVDTFTEAIEAVATTDEFRDILARYYAEPFYRDAETADRENREEVEVLKEIFAE